MIPRARSLTDIFNLFHPKALTADQLDFYQRTGQVRSGLAYEYHESLFQKIKTSNDNLHLLVIGHSGCGKSTELHILSDKLHDITMHSIFIKALDDLSLNDFTYIDIFILMVKRLVEYAANQHLRVDKRILSSFKLVLSTKTTQAYWNTDTLSSIEAGVSISLPLLLQVVAKITSALKLSSGIKEEVRFHRLKNLDTKQAFELACKIIQLNGIVQRIPTKKMKEFYKVFDTLLPLYRKDDEQYFDEDIDIYD